MLHEADLVAESQKVIKPTEEEKGCISKFCTLSIRCKKLESEAKERLKEIKPEVKRLRNDVLVALKSENAEILQIPQALRKEANTRAAASGIPPLPAYVRLAKNAKDLSITPDVIEEAFNALTEEDVLESEGDGADALISAVLTSVRRIVRSFNEQAKITDSLPRGVKAADVQLANEDFAREAIRLHFQSSIVLGTEREKREAVSAVKEELNTKSSEVERFFQRSNTTSQRINMENASYNLCCRTTMTRPRVTLKVLEDFLHDGIKECLMGGGSKKPSKQDAAKALRTKKEELQRLVLARLATVSSTSKTVVHLQRLSVKN